MKTKNDLFSLIKSLDKQEKRFFRLYAKLHNQNKSPQYIYLFDIMDQMKHFDNAQIKFELSKALPGKNLSRLKQYLKHHIFIALKAFHKKGSDKLQENEDINTAKILMAKNLYVMAEKILLKLKENAIKQESFQLQLQINTELITIRKIENQVDNNTIELTQQYYEENLSCLEKIKEEMQLRLISVKISKQFTSKKGLKKGFNSSIKQILENDLLAFKAESLLSNKSFFFILQYPIQHI